MAALNPVKFAFGAVFDPARDGSSRDLIDRRQLEAAKAEAYARGKRDGAEEEARATARLDAEALAALARALDACASLAADAHRACDRRAARLALAVARKMAAELVSRAPEAEIEALIRRSLALLAGEPRVVVRLAPAMFDRLGPRLDGLSLGSAFAGQIVLVGDESLGPGDCRIEWADGGTVRDEAAAWREIEAFAERAVGPAPAATPPAADPPPAEQETP